MHDWASIRKIERGRQSGPWARIDQKVDGKGAPECPSAKRI